MCRSTPSCLRLTVPKLLDLPPFTPEAARGVVAAATALIAAGV
jgi:hypothetical protein